MIRKSIVTALKIGAVAFLLSALLFADGIGSSFPGFAGSIFREATAVLRDPETQWMVFLCLGIYFVLFSLLRHHKTGRNFWNTGNPSLWLTGTILIGALTYAFNYSASAQSTDALTLLAGATLGLGMAVWASSEARIRKPAVRNSLGVLIVPLLAILLTLASLWHINVGSIFEYRGHTRWSGPWNNPNEFGLLMGVGVVLAAGGAISCVMCHVSCATEDGSRKMGVRKYLKWIFAFLCLIAAMLMVRGLLHSYSRGAWLAAICGLGYLTCQVLRCQVSSVARWARANTLSLAIILLSLCALAFWQFQHAEHKHMVAKRAFSAVNANDFSWRNRINAWEGALQIMAEHPWLGAGWNRPESLYDHYYLSPKSEENAAIQLNDYLMLGATLGVPALICFVTYIWLSLTQKPEDRRQKTEIEESEIREVDWSQTICRAGAIVLLVGFWFDGGLFELPTASMFWILLGLGSANMKNRTVLATDERRFSQI